MNEFKVILTERVGEKSIENQNVIKEHLTKVEADELADKLNLTASFNQEYEVKRQNFVIYDNILL